MFTILLLNALRLVLKLLSSNKYVGYSRDPNRTLMYSISAQRQEIAYPNRYLCTLNISVASCSKRA